MDDPLYFDLYHWVAFMRIRSVTLHEYQRSMGNQKRSGLLLQLKGKRGEESWGEIAPLPPFSPESLHQAKSEVLREIPSLLKEKWHPKTLFPSVHFGIESALLDFLLPIKVSPPPVNALLRGPLRDIGKMGENLQGYEAVKIKVGHLSLEKSLSLIQEVLPLLPPKIKLRIDANRSWSLKEALSFASAFPPNLFEYFEEPLAHFQDLFSFPYPIALDETIRSLHPDSYFSLPHLKALVIKPTLMGGMGKLISLLKRAQKKGIAFILSSSYESELGISLIAKLASRLHLPKTPMGLDTNQFFEKPLFEKTTNKSRGKLIFPKKWKLNSSLIIAHEYI